MNRLKKFREKLAEKAGFTLVELIVVIAILGILAAVAVPAYTGYITKAHAAADITQLDAIKTAAISAKATKGAPTKIVVETDSTGKVTDVKVDGPYGANGAAAPGVSIFADSDFKLYLTGSSSGTISVTMESETYKTGANWTPSMEEWATGTGTT